MTHVWLVDFDGRIENLALMKLSTFHKTRGATVLLKKGYQNHVDLFEPTPDRVCISCLFSWNKKRALKLQQNWGAEIGGTGADYRIVLSEGVEALDPDYSLYGKDRAIGFISRGCGRMCPWCVVWRKEGKIHRVSTAKDIVNQYTAQISSLPKAVIFLDNNLLELEDFYKDIEWLADSRLRIDFNQGLDARRIDLPTAKLLKKCRWTLTEGIRIALDSEPLIPAVDKAVRTMATAGILPKQICVFALIGFEGIESDVRRLLFLHEKGVRPFPMGFRDLETGNEPMKGWDPILYKKYKRLIIRAWWSDSVWEDFKREVKF